MTGVKHRKVVQHNRSCPRKTSNHRSAGPTPPPEVTVQLGTRGPERILVQALDFRNMRVLSWAFHVDAHRALPDCTALLWHSSRFCKRGSPAYGVTVPTLAGHVPCLTALLSPWFHGAVTPLRTLSTGAMVQEDKDETTGGGASRFRLGAAEGGEYLAWSRRAASWLALSVATRS